MAARPALLTADNLTPPERTPWGGRRILDAIKAGVLDPARREAQTVAGESWEVSVEPDFPAHAADTGRPLSALIADDPTGWLGEDVALGSTALLVKLLDAADVLSVQIHPADDHPGLGPGECGKPESWYVLHREEGSGLYLGLRAGVDRARMERALAEGGDVGELLSFVPVEPGDFFVIEAGTAHAIGAGVTLVEPQRVAPGRRGITYRYYDWGRRYDAAGRRDPAGRPRALHVEQALDVTAWDAPREEALLSRVRLRAGPPDLRGAARLDPLCGPDGPVRSAHLRVARLCGDGDLRLPPEPRLRGLTVVEGTVRLAGTDAQAEELAMEVPAGRSAVLPACLPEVTLILREAHAVIASAH